MNALIDLPTIEQINLEHDLAHSKANEAVQHATNCGLMLLQIKSSLNHGEWLPWLNGEIESGRLHVKARQARSYMQLASNWQRDANLVEAPSIRAALELLSDKEQEPEQSTFIPVDVEPIQQRSTTVAANGNADSALLIKSTADPRKLGYVGSSPVADRDSNDWHTPARYIDAIKAVMGDIDLDPFSSATANETIQAKRFFTVENNAFNDTAWQANSLFMNPPYSRGLIGAAIDRFLDEWQKQSFKQAIVLVNNSTETHWFQSLLRECLAVCFIDHRIAFNSPDNKQESGNTRGQALFYFNCSTNRGKYPIDVFTEIFDEFGTVMLPAS